MDERIKMDITRKARIALHKLIRKMPDGRGCASDSATADRTVDMVLSGEISFLEFMTVLLQIAKERQKAETRFQDLVRRELQEARKLHSRLNSPHEAWAVILEELDEFKKEVFQNAEVRDATLMLRKLVQTAAMCQRAAEDLGLTPRSNASVCRHG